MSDAVDVLRVARLARLSIAPAEEAKISAQIREIISYLGLLDEAETADIPPLEHAGELESVFREDEPRQSLPPEDVFRNAPRAESGFFVVPRVVYRGDGH